MTRIIAVANQKGGVAKTTTVANLGAVLAEKGFRVLVVDLDPQAALTAYCGVNPHELEKSVYQVLLAQELDPESVIIKDVRPNLDLLPATLDLAGAEIELVGELGREYLLKEALAAIKDQYDFILIDCGPSLGLLTINALTAADEVLIPLVPEYLALRGMGILFDTIGRVRAHSNKNLRILGILITLFDSRTIHSREVVEELQAMFGDYVFTPVIPKSIRFAESAAASRPIIEYEPKHPGAAGYRTLAEEIIHEQK